MKNDDEPVKARWLGDDLDSYEDLEKPGDIGIGAENYHYGLMVQCPVCYELHVAPIRNDQGYRVVWEWNQSTLTLSPSYRCESPQRGVCHWNLTNGDFIVHSDSTAKPRESYPPPCSPQKEPRA
jgi:hypothetical protein